MKFEKISIKAICIITGMGLILTSMIPIIILYRITENRIAIYLSLLIIALAFFWNLIFMLFVRKKIVDFSSAICRTIDDMLNGNIEPPQVLEEETLFFKINHRLGRLYEIMRENRRKTADEKAALQELISDISHQVKTPISNLKIVTSTLLGKNIPEEKQYDFLHAMIGQLDKLEFLMQAMIKTSRLETGIISLKIKNLPIYDTLAVALGGIVFTAENKNIRVSISCPEDLIVPHDSKWTSEALFNILDNAVKYTQNNGEIKVTVERGEMYLKIEITDTGKGIMDSHQTEIFKRFYREEDVHEIDGIGIGLYLSRKIINMHGGYIKVYSEVGHGSTFSVFLLCE